MKKILLLLGAIAIVGGCSKEISNFTKSSTPSELQKEDSEYVQGLLYQKGDVVSFKGSFYECIKTTDTQPGESEAWLLLSPRVAWASGVTYTAGDIVSYNGKNYKCIMTHTSNTAWYPTAAPSIWVEIDSGGGDNNGGNPGGINTGGDTSIYTPWQSGQIYNEGDKVSHNGKNWLCKWYTNTEPGTTDKWGPWEEVTSTSDGSGGNQSGGELISAISNFTNKIDVGKSQRISVTLRDSTSTLNWLLISKPLNSNVSISSTGASFNFTPDKTGKYEFEVQVKNGSTTENRRVVVEANRAIALLNGIDYPGDDIKCEVDISNIRKILDPNKFTINEFRSAQVVKSNLFNELDKMANLLEAGDIFVFYFSGHGSKIPETTTSTWGLPIDEQDGVDETLYMYNKEHLVDDELDIYWKKFKEGVRIVTISDSCHSGTVYKNIQVPVLFSIDTNMNFQTRSIIKAELIHFSGCLDAELSYGNNVTGGVFTNALVDSYKSGTYNSYPALYKNVSNKFAGNKQTPDYHEYNASSSFINSKPFSR